MTYSELYPDAREFHEPQELLFKQIESYRCLSCREWTMWLTYRFHSQPVAVCSPDCMEDLVRLSMEPQD